MAVTFCLVLVLSTLLTIASSPREAAAFGLYNRAAAVAYADQWTSNTQNLRNPNYPTSWGNDCTNFASQVLYAGGYPVRGNTDDYCNVNEWYRPYQIFPGWWVWTWSWSVADCQRQYFSYHPSEFELYGYSPVYLPGGSILQMSEDGSGLPTHSRVLIGSGYDAIDGQWYANLTDQHTTDRYHRYWNIGIESYWPLWAWHITY